MFGNGKMSASDAEKSAQSELIKTINSNAGTAVIEPVEVSTREDFLSICNEDEAKNITGPARTAPNSDWTLQFSGKSGMPLPGIKAAAGDRHIAWAHQLLTIEKAVRRFQLGDRYAILSDSVGAGKSDQVMGIFWRLRELGFVKRLVLCVPEATLKDWQDTIERYDGPLTTLTIDLSDDWIKYNNAKPADVTIVRQTMGFSGSLDESTTVRRQNFLKEIFSDSTALLVLDEFPHMYKKTAEIVANNPQVLKCYVSSTIVSTSLSDVARIFSDNAPNQNIARQRESWPLSIERACQTGFSEPESAYLSWLNLATTIQGSVHLRERHQLGLNIPKQAPMEYRILEEDPSINVKMRSSVKYLFCDSGVGTKLDTGGRARYRSERHYSESMFNELKSLIDSADKGSGFLVVCATDKDARQLRGKLKEARCNVYMPQGKKARKSDHDAKKVSVYVTSLKKAEGFNIQEQDTLGLKSIAFFGAAERGDEVQQAIGRAVRPWERPVGEDDVIKVYMILMSKYKQYVEETIKVTLNGREFMHCMAKDPVGTFYDLAQSQGGDLQHIKEKCQKQLEALCYSVKQEMSSTSDDFYTKLVQGETIVQRDPFLLADLDQLKDGYNDDFIEEIKSALFGQQALSYQNFVKRRLSNEFKFEQLLNSDVIDLAFSFNAINLWKARIDAVIRADTDIPYMQVTDLLNMLAEPRIRAVFVKELPEYLQILLVGKKYDDPITLTHFLLDPAIRQLFLDAQQKNKYIELCLSAFTEAPKTSLSADTPLKFAQYVGPLLEESDHSALYRKRIMKIENFISCIGSCSDAQIKFIQGLLGVILKEPSKPEATIFVPAAPAASAVSVTPETPRSSKSFMNRHGQEVFLSMKQAELLLEMLKTLVAGGLITKEYALSVNENVKDEATAIDTYNMVKGIYTSFSEQNASASSYSKQPAAQERVQANSASSVPAFQAVPTIAPRPFSTAQALQTLDQSDYPASKRHCPTSALQASGVYFEGRLSGSAADAFSQVGATQSYGDARFQHNAQMPWPGSFSATHVQQSFNQPSGVYSGGGLFGPATDAFKQAGVSQLHGDTRSQLDAQMPWSGSFGDTLVQQNINLASGVYSGGGLFGSATDAFNQAGGSQLHGDTRSQLDAQMPWPGSFGDTRVQQNINPASGVYSGGGLFGPATDASNQAGVSQPYSGARSQSNTQMFWPSSFDNAGVQQVSNQASQRYFGGEPASSATNAFNQENQSQQYEFLRFDGS